MSEVPYWPPPPSSRDSFYSHMTSKFDDVRKLPCVSILTDSDLLSCVRRGMISRLLTPLLSRMRSWQK